MEKKYTPAPLELKYVSDVCIGIGTSGNFSQITANSILPDTDEEYEKEKGEIEANMRLYASAPELLEALQDLIIELEDVTLPSSINLYVYNAKQAIAKALGKQTGEG